MRNRKFEDLTVGELKYGYEELLDRFTSPVDCEPAYVVPKQWFDMNEGELDKSKADGEFSDMGYLQQLVRVEKCGRNVRRNLYGSRRSRS